MAAVYTVYSALVICSTYFVPTLTITAAATAVAFENHSVLLFDFLLGKFTLCSTYDSRKRGRRPDNVLCLFRVYGIPARLSLVLKFTTSHRFGQHVLDMTGVILPHHRCGYTLARLSSRPASMSQ